MLRAFLLALALLVAPVSLTVVLAPAAWAVEPDEILADPELESRARALSTGLRCVVCRNESIDESNAELARDMRLLVRERLVAGDSDAEVVQFLVDRYGEFVLLRPRRDGVNRVLWFAAPVLLGLGLGLAALALRRRAKPPAPLSPSEEARLREIMRD